MNVTVPVAVEAVDAVRVSGFCSRIGFDEEVIVRVEVAGATVKLALWVRALKRPAANWLAWTATVPAPVRVRVEPDSVAGPERTE
jgi:hypothetical protein